MKQLLIILAFPFISYTQVMPDTCFTEDEIHGISETLDSLFYRDSINELIILEQDSIINYLETVIKLDSVELQIQTMQMDLLKSNIDLYIEREKLLKPKWYRHPAIWFVGGIVTTVLTGKLVATLIN